MLCGGKEKPFQRNYYVRVARPTFQFVLKFMFSISTPVFFPMSVFVRASFADSSAFSIGDVDVVARHGKEYTHLHTEHTLYCAFIYFPTAHLLGCCACTN